MVESDSGNYSVTITYDKRIKEINQQKAQERVEAQQRIDEQRALDEEAQRKIKSQKNNEL